MEAWLAAALRLAAPLWLAALGELVVERAGVIHIGIEGGMLLGAFLAFAVGVVSGSAALGTTAAAAGGAALALLFAAFAVVRRADQIVTGMAVNLLALGLTGLLFRGIWKGLAPAAPHVGPLELPALTRIPGLGPVLFAQSPFVHAAALASVAVGLWLRWTRAGLRLRAVGESARAADAEGIAVARTRTLALVFGGTMAGLAGAGLTLAQSSTFGEAMTAGRGFLALTVVIFGRWSALGTTAAALFLGAAFALQFRLQAQGFAIPYPAFLVLPYVLTLLALGFGSRQAEAPGDLGRPFERGSL